MCIRNCIQYNVPLRDGVNATVARVGYRLLRVTNVLDLDPLPPPSPGCRNARPGPPVPASVRDKTFRVPESPFRRAYN